MPKKNTNSKTTTMTAMTSIDAALPLLRLGQDVYQLHISKYPPLLRKMYIEDDMDTIKKRINSRLASAGKFLITASFLNKTPNNTLRKKAQILTIALLAYRQLRPWKDDTKFDRIANMVGAAMNEDNLTGLLSAKHAIADILVTGDLTVDEKGLHLSKEIKKHILGDSTILVPGLTDIDLKAYIEKQRKQKPNSTNNVITHTNKFMAYIKAMPLLTPAEMDAEILASGFVGQDKARRACCLAAYRHVQRLKKQFIEGIKPDLLPERENMLLHGPTGCGKTYLIKSICRILKIPSVIIDLTSYSETGYVGNNVNSICTRLINNSRGNIQIAQTGLVFLDEFDKIASNGDNEIFNGGSSGKDLSGSGVQRSLLKLLEPSVMEVPAKSGKISSLDKPRKFRTGNVLFIGAGSFSGLERLHQNSDSIGFCDENISFDSPAYNPRNSETFTRYGIRPEIFGRFGSVLAFESLSREHLIRILEDSTIRRYRNELDANNIDLKLTPEVSNLLVNDCLERKTGARGLAASMVGILNEALFELYSTKGRSRKLVMLVEDDKVRWSIESPPKISKPNKSPANKTTKRLTKCAA